MTIARKVHTCEEKAGRSDRTGGETEPWDDIPH